MMNKLNMQKVHEITFAGGNLNSFTVKLADVFRTKGYKINSISRSKLRNEFEHSFDNNYYFFDSNLRFRREDNLNPRELYEILIVLKKDLKNFLKFCLAFSRIKKSIVIGQSEPNDFVALIFLLLGRRAICKICFSYDISYFRYKKYNRYSWLERFAEKYNFRHCDGIMHKGAKDELKYLPKEFKALEKPGLQFLPYCNENAMIGMDEEFFERKLSKKDGGTHLVYVGGIYHNNSAHYPTIDVFKKIVKQKLHLHVYAHPMNKYEELIKDPEYIALGKTSYFKLHKPMYGKELQNEISIYDWGIYIFHTNFQFFKHIWANTAYGNKISTYIEAGLPIITNTELSFVSSVIKEHGFGIVINDETKIRDAINCVDYEKMINRLLIERKTFTTSNHIDDIFEFIDLIEKMKTK